MEPANPRKRRPERRGHRRAQAVILTLAVALLLAAIWRIYETKLAMAPTNLEGNIATEGGMTANPPVP